MSLTPPPAPPDPSLWRQPEYKRGRQFTLEADFAPLFAAIIALPNFEPIPHWQALRASMGYGKTVERFRDPSKHFDESTKAKVEIDVGADKPRIYGGNAIYHLNCGQGGGFTGEGVVVIDATGHFQYRAVQESIITGRFAICKHESVEDPGANHSRGWHPAHCKKCGLDMSVDSGD
jgi:hypothetical protein